MYCCKLDVLMHHPDALRIRHVLLISPISQCLENEGHIIDVDLTQSYEIDYSRGTHGRITPVVII